jgi:hypothetical protein
MKSLAFVGVGVLLSTTVCSLLDSRAEEKRPQNSFSAAHCHGSIAKTEWTLADGNSPTPACVEGKDLTKGVLAFDADEAQGALVPFTLPGHFTGKLNVKLTWQPASTIGSVGWCVTLVTGSNLKRGGGAPLTQAARSCASDPAKKSPQHLTTALVINVPATAPAADNDVWHIRVSRDANSSVVLDDMPGDARLIGVVIETQEAPRRTL